MANYAVTLITNNTTLDGNVEYIIIDATSSSITCTLPVIGSDGDSYAFKRNDSSSNTVTLATQGSDTINGQSSITMSAGQFFRVISYTGNFYVL